MDGNPFDAHIRGHTHDLERVSRSRVPARANLDRYRDLYRLDHGFERFSERKRIAAHCGACAFFGHLGNRAPQVEIDKISAHALDILRSFAEQLSIIAKNL